MLIKRILMTCLCLTLSWSGIAQTSATQILARAEKAIASVPSGEANFTSAYLDARGKVQSRVSGIMYLEGDKFRLTYGDIIAVYKPNTLSYHDAKEATLTISEPSSEELIQINPLHFLRAKGKGFRAGEPVCKGGLANITFTPERKSGIKQMMMSFIEKTCLPSVVSITAHDGSKVVVTINAFRASKVHPSSYFELQAKQFPKSEVVDLR